MLTFVFVATGLAAVHETVNLGAHQALSDRVLARFKGKADGPDRDRLLAEQGVSVVHRYTLVPDLVVLKFDTPPRLNSLPGPRDPDREGRVLLARIKKLMLTGLFTYVEPNYVVRTAVTPTDSAYVDGTLWGLNDISAPSAWDITTGSAGVVVAVIDSGVNYQHQDLSAQMWINPGEIAGNGIDDDANGYVDDVHGINAVVNGGDPRDDNGHGSHVAGTIGASANDAGPHVGVAWNVRIMALKFLDASGSGSLEDAIECLDYARQKGAHIMNNSWGGGPFSTSLFDSIQATRNAGMLFVAAAGNEANNNDVSPAYPASYNVDNIISVAAVDINSNLANFSNFGSQSVDIGAPGVNIFSCLHSSPTAYGPLNGTSMASPHVAGVAALLWAQLQPTTISGVADLRQRILAGSVATPSLNGKVATGSRLNAALALGVGVDGELELAITSERGLQVIGGRVASFFVRVSDLFPVNNALVNGTVSFGGSPQFVNNGTGPDATANDGTYSTSFTVPAGISSFTLSVNVTANGKNPASAVATFTVIPAPSNDSFAGRLAISDLPAIFTGSTLDATDEPGEPIHISTGFGQRLKTLWWTWTAPTAGVYTLTTDGSSFDTMLAAYTGSTLGSLVRVQANDDAGFDWTSTLVFTASAGTPYQFVVDGYYYEPGPGESEGETEAGGVQLNFSANAPMLNNNFANRTAIAGINVVVNGHNVGASSEAGEPFHDGFSPSRSVWWSWTAPASETVTISTAGSSFNTVLAVYVGNSLGGLSLVGSHDNIGEDTGTDTLTSEVTFFAQAGATYQIAVDRSTFPSGTATQGNIRLLVARRPVNDNFANRLPLSGDLVQTQAFTMGASFEGTEDSPVGNFPGAGRSVWWTWTAPRSGKATITTDGSNFDTVVGVYRGSTLSTLTEVASNDDRVLAKIRTSLVNFGAEAGTTYHIQVDGFAGLAGEALVTLMMDGRSELALPELRADNSSTVELLGEPDRIYVLRATSDFVTWSGVATNTVVSRKTRFRETRPAGMAPRFYRAEPASLLGGE